MYSKINRTCTRPTRKTIKRCNRKCAKGDAYKKINIPHAMQWHMYQHDYAHDAISKMPTCPKIDQQTFDHHITIPSPTSPTSRLPNDAREGKMPNGRYRSTMYVIDVNVVYVIVARPYQQRTADQRTNHQNVIVTCFSCTQKIKDVLCTKR